MDRLEHRRSSSSSRRGVGAVCWRGSRGCHWSWWRRWGNTRAGGNSRARRGSGWPRYSGTLVAGCSLPPCEGPVGKNSCGDWRSLWNWGGSRIHSPTPPWGGNRRTCNRGPAGMPRGPSGIVRNHDSVPLERGTVLSGACIPKNVQSCSRSRAGSVGTGTCWRFPDTEPSSEKSFTLVYKKRKITENLPYFGK